MAELRVADVDAATLSRCSTPTPTPTGVWLG
jgi:hypothetical protein